MEEKFKPGDIVMLKSGGPKMTVREFGNKLSYGLLENIYEI